MLALVLWIGAIVFLALGARAALRTRAVAKDADGAYEAYADNAAAGLSLEQFRRAYGAVYGARGLWHIVLSLGVSLALTVPAILAFRFVWVRIWRATGQANWTAEGTIVYGVAVAVFLTVLWAAISFPIARRYHKRHPGDLDEALTRSRSEA